MTAIAVAAIRLYRRTLSPFLPPACRYWPSCSAYAEEALREHGFVPGLSLALARLARCHPWGGHGVDPVPPANPGEHAPHARRASAPGRSA